MSPLSHHFRTLRTLLNCIGLAFALVCSNAMASGGDGYSVNSFAPESYPVASDLPHYAAGQLGVVPGSYWRVYQFLAYRAASGQALSATELQSLDIQGWKIGAIQNVVEDSEDANDPANTWLEARKKIASASTIQLEVTKYDEVNYYGHLNCTDDALRRASKTLLERLQTHGQRWAQVWLSNQDAVFVNCGLTTNVRAGKPKPVSPMPAALPADAPLWLRQDHAYQTAAALFYAGQFETARQQFLAIAKDTISPWQSWGGYLATRCLLRKATLEHDDASSRSTETAQEQEKKWRDQLEMARNELAAQASTFPPAQRLLGWVDARIRPQERLDELALTLQSGPLPSNAPRLLGDYLLIWDANEPSLQAKEPLTQWIAAMQAQPNLRNEAFALARQHWKEHGQTHWLMPLVMHARKGELTADETRAIAAVPPSAAAYVHLQYHLARLEVANGQLAEADQRITGLLQNSSHSVATRNRLLGIKMVTDASREGFFKAAARAPAEPEVPGPITDEAPAAANRTATPVALTTDTDYLHHLYQHFSVEELLKARPFTRQVQSPQFPETVWTRAILLGNYTAADSITPDVMQGRETTHYLYRRYLEASGPIAKRDAATIILANAPELNPFGGAWGCGPSKEPAMPIAEGDTLYTAWPRFISKEARVQAQKELQTFRALPKRSSYLGPLLLDYAQRNPNDAEVPKALHYFIASTRMECPYYGDKPQATKNYSQLAFMWLKKRYPNNEWAVRTKYYY
jgi:hypothetical protein